MRWRDRPWSLGFVLLAVALGCATLLGCATRPAPPTPAPETADGPSASIDWAARAAARLPMLEPCTRPNLDAPLLCGTLEVPEDRSRPEGRSIALSIVVVPAEQAEPPDDPVFVFEGGPGGAATGRAAASVHAGPVRQRDIVLVDQRGTGDSNRLDCVRDRDGAGEGDDAEGGRVTGRLREIFPRADIEACLETLSARADVTQYTSVDHADDIEAVRRFLGYGPINLRGGSYGTRAMMVFAQRHPASTRTLFGIGVDSPLRSNLAERGALAERALEGVGRLCAAEPECAALAPDLHAMVGGLLEGLDATSRRVTLADPTRPGEPLTIDVERTWFGEQLRLILYFAFTSRALPWAVHRAVAADDWVPAVTLAVIIERMFESSLATGMALTIQCGEHMDFDVEAALEAGRRTLFGNYRLAQQVQGCDAWRYEPGFALGKADPDVLDIPALFLSGELDAVTPPAYAEDARTLFPNSAHVVIEGGQHGPFDLEGAWPCVHRMWADLLDHADVGRIDTTCAEDLSRPPFLLDRASFEAHVEDNLAPLAGG